LTQAVATTIFGLPVGLFTLFGLTVFSLGLAMALALTGNTTFTATIGLPSKTTPAYIKYQLTPSAAKLK